MTDETLPDPPPGLSGTATATSDGTPATNPKEHGTASPLQSAFAGLFAALDEINRQQESQRTVGREMVERFIALMFKADEVRDKVIETLLDRGWCPSYGFTDGDIIHLGKLADAVQGEQIDYLMADFTRNCTFRDLMHSSG